jgi:hypothetical protein
MPESNPFEVLRLGPTATEEEIVRQAARLRQLAPDEGALNAIRQAVQALTANAADRALLAILTHPRPAHSSPVLDRFTAAFRRPPAAGPAPPCPPLDLEELRACLGEAVAADLEWAPLPFEPVDGGEDLAEADRQTAEALWQSLLGDPLA